MPHSAHHKKRFGNEPKWDFLSDPQVGEAIAPLFFAEEPNGFQPTEYLKGLVEDPSEKVSTH